jgi:hypothetical protein
MGNRTENEDNDLSPSAHRLFDVLDEAQEALSYEECEAIADALRANAGGDAPMSPRARRFLARINDRLREVELEEGDAPWISWRQIAWEYITEPVHGKRVSEMTPDELEHEIERLRKYRPSTEGEK